MTASVTHPHPDHAARRAEGDTTFRRGLFPLGRRGAAALALALAAAAAAGVAFARRAPDHPRARAERLHRAGLDAYARGDAPAASAAWSAALAADSTFVPALADRFSFGAHDAGDVALVRRIRDDARHPLRRCADALMEQLGFPPERTAASGVCDGLHRLIRSGHLLPQDERIRLAFGLVRRFPESVYLLNLALGEALSTGRYELILTWASRYSESNSVLAAIAETMAAQALHRTGQHGAAMAREHAWVGRRLPPGTQVVADRLNNHSDHVRAMDSVPPAVRRHADSLLAAAEWRGNWRATPLPGLRYGLAQQWLRILIDGGRLTEALTEATAVEALADSMDCAVARAEAAFLHGRAAVKAGRYDLAEQRLLHARTVAAAHGLAVSRWESAHNLLHLYEATGRDSLALAAGLDFVRVTESVPLRAERMMSYRDLGTYLRQRGRWAEAQHWFERMVKAVDSLRLGTSDVYAGEYFESVGQLERAMTYYGGRALAENPERVLPALVRVAELLGDTALALRYAAQHDGLSTVAHPEVRPLLPGVLARMGRLDEAVTRLEAARREAAFHSRRAAWGRLTSELAAAELARGNDERALALARSTEAIGDPGEREFAMRAAGVRAVAAARLGQPEARAFIDRVSRARAEAAATGAPALAAEMGLFEGDARLAAGDTAGALAALVRAQALVDSLAGIADGDVTRTTLFGAQHSASTRALRAVLARRGAPDAARSWRAWSDRRKARTLGARAIEATARALPPGRAVVDYVLLDSTIAALVQAGGRSVIRDLGARPREVAAKVAQLYAHAAPRVGSMVDASRARLDPATLAWLSDALLAPLAEDLASATQIDVVPDGFLHRVPFDVLPLHGTALVERVAVTLLPSLRQAGRTARARPQGDAVIVAGPAWDAVDPPGAEGEVRAVASATRSRRVRLLDREGATETAVRDAMHGAAILHVAAHARPNGARPDLAEILLAPDAAADGRLQAFEIRGVDMHGAIVVLSACETGSGPVAGGEGPMSLARAFLQAGASAVVATLWPVQQSAAPLMAEFHQRLDQGLDAATALREAKIALLRRGASALSVAPFIVLVSPP